MNIYDFDNTIINGDSSYLFFKYSFKKHPLLIFKSLLKTIPEIIKYLFGFSKKGMIKSKLYSFVTNIPNLDEYVNDFILKYNHLVKDFYLKNQKDNDVIISATYDFIVEPFCHSLGIKNVIATKYDVKKGILIGNHCKGEEKIKRFNTIYKDKEVNEAYSDSLSDIPMFERANKAYLVKGNEITLYKK